MPQIIELWANTTRTWIRPSCLPRLFAILAKSFNNKHLREIRMVKQEGLSPLTNTSKLQLPLESLLLKLAWGLAEQLFYHQDCKERSTQSG